MSLRTTLATLATAIAVVSLCGAGVVAATGVPVDDAFGEPVLVPGAEFVPEAELVPGAEPGRSAEHCRGLEAELENREERDVFDWTLYDEDGEEELTEEELELIPTPVLAFDGTVLVEGQRREFDRFGSAPKRAELTDADLLFAVGECYGLGVLGDDEPLHEEQGGERDEGDA